ncbi:C3a anaphylatoxin chemotactic receptor-like [Xenopus laevis]|uniref:C3a anaphylatoxin chemotactic receptor-like n=1 Tax=Xenopus laevis TaxID=8355 RepID=A0A8J1LD54_XENLA|nr:C3a anaphylatoxin chemotactic receptor-like [Xenopus laevis]
MSITVTPLYNISKEREDFYGNRSDGITLPPNTYGAMRIFSIICHSITCIVGIIGNGFVIWIAGFKMSSISAKWYLNLAITDFICSASTVLRIAEWIHQDYFFLCLFSFVLLLINMLTSVYFLTAISIDRCITIMWPFWAKTHRTKKSATAGIVITWIMSLLFSVIIFFVYLDSFHDLMACAPEERSSYFVYNTSKVENFEYKKHPVQFTVLIVMFLLPFTIILLCYGFIVCKVATLRRANKSQRSLKIIIAIVTCFFGCWFPYNLWQFTSLRTNIDDIGVDLIISSISVCLVYTSSCLNPILYVFLGRDFKSNLIKSIPAILKNAFSDPDDRTNREADATDELAI